MTTADRHIAWVDEWTQSDRGHCPCHQIKSARMVKPTLLFGPRNPSGHVFAAYCHMPCCSFWLPKLDSHEVAPRISAQPTADRDAAPEPFGVRSPDSAPGDGASGLITDDSQVGSNRRPLTSTLQDRGRCMFRTFPIKAQEHGLRVDRQPVISPDCRKDLASNFNGEIDVESWCKPLAQFFPVA